MRWLGTRLPPFAGLSPCLGGWVTGWSGLDHIEWKCGMHVVHAIGSKQRQFEQKMVAKEHLIQYTHSIILSGRKDWEVWGRG